MLDTGPDFERDFTTPLKARGAARMACLDKHRADAIAQADPTKAAMAHPDLIQAFVMVAIDAVVDADGSIRDLGEGAALSIGVPVKDARALALAAGIPDKTDRTSFGTCPTCVWNRNGGDRGWGPPCSFCNGYRTMHTTEDDLAALNAGTFTPDRP